MGKSQRRKGQRGECEAAAVWQSLYPDAHRGLQAQGGHRAADVEGTPLWIECKTLARIAVLKHLDQAESNTDGRPCVVRLRRNRDTRAVVLLREEFLLELLQRLGGAV